MFHDTIFRRMTGRVTLTLRLFPPNRPGPTLTPSRQRCRKDWIMQIRWNDWLKKISPDMTGFSGTTLAIWIVIGLGILLRARQYFFDRSLWIDEALLANNIIQRSFFGLSLPLDNFQFAPGGFLTVEKILSSLAGDSEYVLRLFPFLAGCVALIEVYLLARKLMGTTGQLLVLSVFAVNEQLIFQSVSVKQYSVDMAVGLALYLFAFWFFEHPSEKKRFLLLGLIGVASLWFSQPALFTLAGLGMVIVIHFGRKKEFRQMAWSILAGIIWIAYFGLLYLAQYSHLAYNSWLTEFWSDFFMPLSLPAIPGWLIASFNGILINPVGFSQPTIIAALLVLIGTWFIAQKDLRWTSIFLVSMALTILASSIHKYPFGARTVLFLVPGIVLGAGKGIEQVGIWLKNIRVLKWVLPSVLMIFLLYHPAYTAANNFIHPKPYEHIKPTMEYLAQNYKPGDVIYIYSGAVPAFHFYMSKYNLEDSSFIDGTGYGTPKEFDAQLDELAGQKRVWILFSHIYEKGDFNDRDYILAYLDTIGDKKREYRISGTSVYLYLYDLR